MLKTNHCGTITRLSTGGRDIFYPEREISPGKTRGGNFLAAPLIGKKPKTAAWEGVDLPQHGFVRKVPLGYPVRSDHSKEDAYKNFLIDFPAREGYPWSFEVSHRQYLDELPTPSLQQWVTIGRDGGCKNKRQMPVSFGLHPYFATYGQEWRLFERGEVVALGNKESQLQESQQINLRGGMLYLQLANWVFRLELYGFDQITVWTDAPEHYICIEPTKGRREEVLLAPGQRTQASCCMTLLQYTPPL